MEFEFNEFKRILDIPECYRQTDIDQQILKPAIRELTTERNLFDKKRIIFKDLKYTKIKKGGNKVTAIRFNWDITQELESEKLNSESEKAISGTCIREPNLQAYCGIDLNIKTCGGWVKGKIKNAYSFNDKIIMEIESENLEITNFSFENLDELEKCVTSYKI